MKHPTIPTIPRLPKKSLLRRFMPDDYRYGDVYGYTEAQMRDYANKSVNLVLNYSDLKIERLQKLLEQQDKELEKLREALTWYEDKVREAKWGVLHNDYGRKARAVLENKDE